METRTNTLNLLYSVWRFTSTVAWRKQNRFANK